MGLRKIRLELARTPENPEGRSDCGYEFTAPLDDSGYLDSEDWQNLKAECSVRRFWQNEDDEHGRLVHHRGGQWAFHYDDPADLNEDEEPIFKFDRHAFVEGEYVSITEHDGVQRPFRVMSVS